jgi:hypothetical protein
MNFTTGTGGMRAVSEPESFRNAILRPAKLEVLNIFDFSSNVLVNKECLVTATSRYEMGEVIRETHFGAVIDGTPLNPGKIGEHFFVRSTTNCAIKKYSKEKLRESNINLLIN